MGIFPVFLSAWIYTGAFGVLGFFGLCGVLYLADRKHTRAIFCALSVISIIAIITAWFTGFTFHLNTSAPLPDDRILYTFPYQPGPPDSINTTDLVAVRERDGQALWRYTLNDVSPLGGGLPRIASDDQRVYLLRSVMSPDTVKAYTITALSASSRRQIWRVTADLGGRITATGDGRIMLGDQKTTVFLDASTGRETLRFPFGNATLISGSVIYSCSQDSISAYDTRNGDLLWQSRGAPGCDLVATSDMLIVEGNGVLAALRTADGSLAWRVSEDVESSAPMITGDVVLVSTQAVQYKRIKGALIARRVSDGVLLWQDTMGDYSVLYGAADNITLATNDTAILALRASDGARLWSFAQSDGNPAVIALDDRVVFLRHENTSQIMALNLHTGAMYWQASV